MADWKRLAKDALLADGYIERKEVELLDKAIFADGQVSQSELDFLLDLRNSASKAVQEFGALFAKSVKAVFLADGDLSAKEAAWLEKAILADGIVDDSEKALLKDLKAGAKKCSPEFDALVKKYAG